MSDRTPVSTDDAPSGNTPYSQGVRVGETLYVSGYGPVDPETGDPVEGEIEAQTERILETVAAVVDEAGGNGLADVVKVTVYLTDLADYDRVNDAYNATFEAAGGVLPARVCVEVSRLPEDVRVEMDAIAALSH
jgi:2-iminobutanoate/2-iminopropanoate deaminase